MKDIRNTIDPLTLKVTLIVKNGPDPKFDPNKQGSMLYTIHSKKQ